MCAMGTLRRTGSDHPIRKPPKRRTWVSNYGPARPGVLGGGDRHKYDGVRRGAIHYYIPEQAVRESVNLISRSQARGRLRRQACDRGHIAHALRSSLSPLIQALHSTILSTLLPAALLRPSSSIAGMRTPVNHAEFKRPCWRRREEVLAHHRPICSLALLARGETCAGHI